MVYGSKTEKPEKIRSTLHERWGTFVWPTSQTMIVVVVVKKLSYLDKAAAKMNFYIALSDLFACFHFLSQFLIVCSATSFIFLIATCLLLTYGLHRFSSVGS